MERTLNCTRASERLNADPDIVGPGVLTAYFATAIVTLAAVIYEYLSGLLDEGFLAELDRRVVASAKRWWRHLKRVNTNLSHTVQEQGESVVEARREAVTQFILTLSDQQLITGFAILIAGISDPKHITGYEFTVVSALAWFSTTTHLATLTALRSYLKSRRIVRNLRIAAMLIILLLLMYTLALTPLTVGSTRPVQCFYDSGESGDIYDFPELGILSVLAVFWMILFGYMIRIQDLYFGERHSAFAAIFIVWKIQGRFKADELSIQERFADSIAAQRLSDLLSIPRATGLKRRWLTATIQYNQSFLSALPGLAFSFVYGVSQVVAYRWIFAPRLTPESRRMGFGQSIPLLLLALPFLAGIEGYFGKIALLATWPSNLSRRNAGLTDIRLQALSDSA